MSGFHPTRHPELVSGATVQQTPSALVTRWMLKRVQHDEACETEGGA